MRKKMGYSLSENALEKIELLQSAYDLPNASQTVEACIVKMQTPQELKEFNTFIEKTFAMFSKVRAMHVRRLGVMLKIAEGIGALGLSPEKIKPLFDLFGEYGTEAEMELDIFLEKGATDFAKLRDMLAGVKVEKNKSQAETDADVEYLERVRDFLEREQKKLREILANRDHLRNVISGILEHRRDPAEAEKLSAYDDASDIVELEKLAKEAGQIVRHAAAVF